MRRIHVLHENAAWLPPLAQAFDQRRLPWTEWFLDAGTFDLAAPPPEGVFYNRMSASSHTRDHRYSAELTAAVLAWLTRWGRRVVNGPGALDLEISKARQYAALESHGIATPRTVLVAGREHVLAAAQRHFADQPVILKPNRGGKGLGVQLFQSSDSLATYLASDAYEAPVDGLQLLQEYVRAPARSSRAPNLSAAASFMRSRSIPATGSSFARRMPARSAMPIVRSARRRARNSPSSTAFRTRSACGWNASWRPPAWRWRASSSSPTPRAARWCTT